MALPGISNANEFYSAHYLESVLMDDIKKLRERWAEQARAELVADPTAEINTPEQRFKALRKPWEKLREAEQGITCDSAERLRVILSVQHSASRPCTSEAGGEVKDSFHSLIREDLSGRKYQAECYPASKP
jgi:hypothetical protein